MAEQYLYGSTAVLGDKDIAICGTHGWVCPGDIHYRRRPRRQALSAELLRAERPCRKPRLLQCKHTILLLHYLPVWHLTKPSGFGQDPGKYHVPLCVFGHLHGMQPGTMFPRRYNGIAAPARLGGLPGLQALRNQIDGQESCDESTVKHL